MTTRIKGPRRPRDTYFELVKRFPLRPIRSERELGRAIEVIDSLIDRDDLDLDEQDYLDVLGNLTERCEEEKHPLRPVTDAQMLAFLIEQKRVSQSAVARATGIAVSTISEVLSGKRLLRREHIAKLALFFHVDQGVFLFAE